jgi:lactoylglutathione lyase
MTPSTTPNAPNLSFGYSIVYVPDVAATIEFYESAFGLTRRFIADGNSYGELDTGGTVLAFSEYSMADTHLPDGVVHHDPAGPPAPFEIALVTDDVAGAFAHAVASGAMVVNPPAEQPWGQTVSRVRDPDGVLIEICSPIS